MAIDKDDVLNLRVIRPLLQMKTRNWRELAQAAMDDKKKWDLFANTGLFLNKNLRGSKGYTGRYRFHAIQNSMLALDVWAIATGARYHETCATPRDRIKPFSEDEIHALRELGMKLLTLRHCAEDLAKYGPDSDRGKDALDVAKGAILSGDINEEAAYRTASDGPDFASYRHEAGEHLLKLIGRACAKRAENKPA